MTDKEIEDFRNQEYFCFVESTYNTVEEVYEEIYGSKPTEQQIINFIKNYDKIIKEEEYENRKGYFEFEISEIYSNAEEEERDLTDEEEEQVQQLEEELEELEQYR